jgi:hypothetical protein
MSSFPPIMPLKRLLVTDGLLLTAERWQVAHGYHRQRQNLHFQALYQPGIVTGLGVCVITPSPEIPVQYRDKRWLQIQPGIAIDRDGNPIIVPQPVDYHIAAEPVAERLLVYLVVSFVDPERLASNHRTDIVQETFRIEEKISPPDPTEVELCRILLNPGQVQVRSPLDCMAPGENELDLRHRPLVQLRPRKRVNPGQLTLETGPDSRLAEALNGLQSALVALYPGLHISPGESPATSGHVTLRQGKPPEDLLTEMLEYDLLYLPHRYCKDFQVTEVEILRQYLATGGVILVAVTAAETDLDELMQVRSEIARAIPLTASQPEGAKMQRELEGELVELDQCIVQETRRLAGSLRSLIPKGSQDADGSIGSNHPLRCQPFQFGRFPVLNQVPTELFNWGGVVMLVGELVTAWGGSASLTLGRMEIREAQELGINLLHFAWQRRQMTRCLTVPTPEATPTPSRSNRLDDILNQLED